MLRFLAQTKEPAMDLPTILLALSLAAVAVLAPFALRFDQGGLGGSPRAERGRRVLFVAMTLLFSTGFVALGAAGAGAVLGIDGIAAMVPLAWLWAPLVVVATAAAARRGFGGRAA
jgi:hypothetical protein